MSYFKTTALILAKRPLKEADRLYILYTQDHGKIEAKVRSAAASKSKLAGQVEPISLALVMIAPGKDLETIAGAALLKSFSFGDLKISALAHLAAEMVIKLIKPGLPDARIFQLLLSFFNFLAKHQSLSGGQPNLQVMGKLRIGALRFVWQFLSLLGYQFTQHHEAMDTKSERGAGFNQHSPTAEFLPKLSPESQKLFNSCLAEQAGLTKFQASFKVIAELSLFTKESLRYFGESDLVTYNLGFYE